MERNWGVNKMIDLKNEIRSFLDHNADVPSCIFNEDFDEDEYSEQLVAMGVTLVECHARFGGMDKGSDYYIVSKFSRGDETVYVKFQGYYASHHGSEYESWDFVVPKEVIRVEWHIER
jgi:hypothetical protein